MAAEAAPEILAGLPPWATGLYTFGAVAFASMLGGWQLYKTRREEKAKAETAPAEHDHFDADELLATAPITKFLADVAELNASARITAEAVRNISAAATVWAKTREEGYDELRVWKAVDDRFEKLLTRRQGPPSGGWAGP